MLPELDYFLSCVWEVFSYYLFKYFSKSFLSPSGPPLMRMLVHLMLSQRTLRLSSFLCILIFFYILFCGSDFHLSVLQVIYPCFYLSYYAIDSFLCIQFISVAQSCPTLCDPMNRSTPGLPVHHQLPESAAKSLQSCPTWCDPIDGSPLGSSVPGILRARILEWVATTQTYVHRVSDAIQPSHPLSSPSPSALNLSQHQSLFKRVSSLHQVAKVLELQLQHQSFQ